MKTNQPALQYTLLKEIFEKTLAEFDRNGVVDSVNVTRVFFVGIKDFSLVIV